MKTDLEKQFHLKSPEKQINDFIKSNKNTLEILNAIQPQLIRHFPKSKFSLEVTDRLNWTSESKLLVNVHVKEEMFFNGMLNHFNDIYSEIEPLIKDILCPVVLFPELDNDRYDKMSNLSAINLIARTAYFNNDYDGSIDQEILIREIPRKQAKMEIIEYCKSHEDIFAPDIEKELQIDFTDICEILEELKYEGKIQKI